MGLLGGIARTAVVAGTATAVSNRVSRRQARRWQNQEAQAAYGQPADPYGPSNQQYAQPPEQDAQQPEPYAQPLPPADPTTEQIERLASLHSAGVLSDDEFAAAKARLLGL
ncbi:SHOCT domain-containing protein [Microlunatus elymi]|nr:SHOCT domain-containing protein [Microlunatus elymi]